jgi:ribosome-associated toxin RatA of RatAB toxin-antitoxin module
MARITESTIIDRPVEEVWRFVSDVSNTPKWYQGTLEVRQQSEGPLAVGTTFEADVHYRGHSLVFGTRCTVLNQNHEVTREFTSGPTKGSKDSWRIEPIDETSTRVTRVFDLSVSGSWRVIQPIIARGTKRAHAAEIHNLKRILEGASQAEP